MCHGAKQSELFTMASLYKYFTRDCRAHFQFRVHSHQIVFFNTCQCIDLWKKGYMNGSRSHCWIGLICNDKVDQALFFSVWCNTYNACQCNAHQCTGITAGQHKFLSSIMPWTGVGDLDVPAVGNYKSHHAPAFGLSVLQYLIRYAVSPQLEC